MLVYAGNASIIDQGINALESGVSWLVSTWQNFVDSGTSITRTSVNATGIELRAVGRSSSMSGVTQTIALCHVDLAAVRLHIDISSLQSKGIRFAVKAIHMLI